MGSETDWQIISEIATRMGYPMHYKTPRRSGMSCVICARISTVRLRENGRTGLHSVALPRYFRCDQGTSYLFKEKFDTPNGLAHSSPATG